MTPATIRFLEEIDVLRLHSIAITDQGGDPSLRDRGLLLSALAQPAQQFGGDYLHDGIAAMAAAYAFHICKNHPFIDGNKRAAFASMAAFLVNNHWSLDASIDEAEQAILRLASGETDKATFTAWVSRNCHQKPSLELRTFMQRVSLSMLATAGGSFQLDPFHPTSKPETYATLNEVRAKFPAVEELVAGYALMANPPADAITHTAVILKTLVALYRIAEDMGYEW